MRAALVTALVVAGCFHPDPPDGALACGSGDSCPDGYQCVEGACYRHGHLPDLQMSVADDLSVVPADGGADLAVLVDAAMPDGSADAAAVDMAQVVLADSYLSDCVLATELQSTVPGAHERNLITFSPNRAFATSTTFYYRDACVTPFFTAATAGTLLVSKGPTTNTLYLDFTVQTVKVRTETTSASANFNTIANCGVTSWASGLFVDVTGRACAAGVLPSAGTIIHSFVEIEGNTLETAGDGTLDASAPWPPFGPLQFHPTCTLVAPQSGCTTPPRCALPLLPTCAAAGLLAVAAACDPLNDTCVAGALCAPTPDGGATPVCRQICDNGLDCTQAGPVSAPSMTAICFDAITTVEQRLCTVSCNPVSAAGSLGCPADNRCDVFGIGQTTAHSDCTSPVGAGTDGVSCSGPSDCANGFDCVSSKCRAYCRTGMSSDCSVGTCVNPMAGPFGHCCPGGTC